LIVVVTAHRVHDWAISTRGQTLSSIRSTAPAAKSNEPIKSCGWGRVASPGRSRRLRIQTHLLGPSEDGPLSRDRSRGMLGHDPIQHVGQLAGQVDTVVAAGGSVGPGAGGLSRSPSSASATLSGSTSADRPRAASRRVDALHRAASPPGWACRSQVLEQLPAHEHLGARLGGHQLQQGICPAMRARATWRGTKLQS